MNWMLTYIVRMQHQFSSKKVKLYLEHFHQQFSSGVEKVGEAAFYGNLIFYLLLGAASITWWGRVVCWGWGCFMWWADFLSRNELALVTAHSGSPVGEKSSERRRPP